ncbi:SulP family inorganic anion transporter [Aldersonia sp. NBC_00410]|uniref:SulP family inorganic anion transporter n=1 Tax=Aldersonia sp. NBC_00410 TaxID=2975954 RepID=UPI002258F9F8|nr:SulP family inorganic anion transporter [Aldersonia sp. NBC_00410]MCX5042070.1 SulP family inorganic anion transporter [Aldersonia sp. NBC_00410]
MARNYQKKWLRNDLVAGVVLTALLIPAGMGYAEAAGLPVEAGLYATIVPLLVYAVAGPSRILVLGPDSSLAPIIAAAILPLAVVGSDRAVALAGLLAIMVGLILVLGGLLRLGFVTDLLSKPIRIGYLNGIALTVVIGQLPKLLGFSVDADTLRGEVAGVVRGISDGEVDGAACAIGIASLLVIVGLRVVGSKVPGVLVAVVAAMILVAVAGLADQIPVVGALPRGLPAPALSGIGWSDVAELIGPAFGIALIAFADSGVLSRTFAARRGESVDGSQEMLGIGAANIGGGLLGGFPVSASSSRTPVAEQAGARSQLCGVVGAILIIAFVLLAPGLTAYLPSSTLAAVVIVAAAGLVDFRGVASLWRVDRVECMLSLAAFVGVAAIGVLEGILIAVGLSFVAFVNNAWRPYRAELGQRPGVPGYHDRARHSDAQPFPGVVIVRWDAPLFFANGGVFDDYVRSVVTGTERAVHTVILAAEPITDVDTTAVDELVELDDYLGAQGITLVFAEMKGPVKDKLRRYELGGRFDADRFSPTLTGAVADASDRDPGGR